MALRRATLRLSSSLAGRCPRRSHVSQAASQDSQSQDQTQEKHKQTHFGFESVDEEEKWKKVHNVFETVAEKYDIMNDAMSLGIHRIWKDIFIQRLAPTHGTKLLDVAGGTGDISFRYINYLRNLAPPPGEGAGPGAGAGEGARRSSVTVYDINQAMLDVGRARANKLGYTTEASGVEVSWQLGDAERLAAPAASYHAYTIAFGIRNCTHLDKVLSEAYRVLAPGGRFLCLEFSRVRPPALQWLYDQYSFQVIPVLGQLVAAQYRPYKYLVESIRQFPHQEEFKSMIEAAGFRQVTYENLTGGVVAIHSGFKL